MNKDLQSILNTIQQSAHLSDEEKNAIAKSLKDANKELEITSFKLERTEKVKHTTSILLEETIEELEQKRKAVEAQNRELEIESSLERVRTAAMAMQQPADMIDICHIISDQLELLNVKEIRNIQTAIFYQDKGTYFNFEYYSFHKKSFVTEVEYINHPMTEEFANRMLRGSGMFYIRNLQEKELKDWYEFQKTTNQFIDTHLEVASSLNYYWYSLGSIALGISTYAPLSEEETNLFKRFRNVFELSYRRYLDIEKAMAQAKEAKIEASLERVRAVAMAMKKSEELITVCEVMYKELKQLGFTNIRNAQIAIKNPDRQSYFISAWSDREKIGMVEAPYQSSPIVKELYEELGQAGDVFYEKEYSGKTLEEWRAWRESISALTDEKEKSATSVCFYFYSIGNGHLGISTYNRIAKELSEILKRFKNVFELSYQRFTDVAKAEAQAREAQIELALERIRARTMAMQKSDELAETVSLLFKQLIDLGIKATQMRTCAIVTLKPDEPVGECWITKPDGDIISQSFIVPYDETSAYKTIYAAWKNGEKFLVVNLSGDALVQHLNFLKKYAKIPTQQFQALPDQPSETFTHAMFFSQGYLFIISNEPLPQYHDIFKRFGKVFEQTYTRFLDLQKAEAQARESQIQLALERVRARTMAMQKSDELSETVFILFQQFKELGENPDQATIGIINEDEWVIEYWVTMYGNQMNRVFKFSIDEPDVTNKIYNSWKEQKKSLVIDLSGKELYDFATYRATMGGASYNEAEKKRVINVAFFSKGILNVQSKESRSAESVLLLERFAKVFEQTYTRFLDLKNAEAQARESQIQLALERVRARTMAMQKSDELKEAAALLFQQVKSLGVPAYSCGYNIWEKNEKTFTSWMSSEDGSIVNAVLNIPLTEDANFIRYVESKQTGEQFFVLELRGKRMQEHYEYLKTIPAFKGYFDYAVSVGFDLPETQIHHLANFSQGNLLFITLEPCPEFHDVFKRFAAVFEQTYTRFLDLQKAEAQAREAQIEAALERVRSRTMAMFKSNELAETAAVVFKQLIELGIEPSRLYITIMNDDIGNAEFWLTDEDGSKVSSAFTGNKNDNSSLLKMYEGWIAQKKSLIIDMQGKELEDYFMFVNKLHVPFKAGLSKQRRIQYIAYFSRGFIGVASPEEQPASTINLLERFAGVFNLTYTRFNDLQKAEAQTREATIEAALEKVRGRAIAMRTSNDVSSTASMVFTELRKLGINPIRSGVALISKEKHRATLYGSTTSVQGDSLDLVGWVMLEGHPVLKSQYEYWLRKEDYFPVLKGELLKTYYETLSVTFSVPQEQSDYEQYGYFLMFAEGFLFCWSLKPYNETEIRILTRFKAIIDLTFRRYLELQKSEANAKEAVKQAALDRIRADIASMRKISDLNRITPLIWNELTVLGISFMRCGVFIMDEEQEQIHTFLSAPDGIAIAAFHIPYSTPGNIQDVLHHWKDKKNYINHWDELAFKEFADTLVKQGALASSEQYLQTIPHGGFHLHFLPFLQGMLYVGNTTQLGDDEINLIQSVADAFSTAYARYEDFNKLEAAKQQVDKTLVDLKQAQSQLIQAEKMASLGELTAGIAHEIQNPLNFVNNFSEVNKELLIEMKDEINKGNIDEIKFIADDIIANEEKINHHGKRADAIVKGMLQHSRTSTSQKEPTNINALADEYLRLAYHGLRAKDKSFNAEMKTDFDATIGKINIIPQDIGRVLLNLYNNAFYAVSEKMKQRPNGYKPVISITTKKTEDKMLISVTDNGNGIPQKVLDKIFQPFFTTKPTGQGTGLGLSLSYDIIKAHGGEIKVNTKENEGSEFVIQLPVV